jgi:hypothetical protein
LAPRSFDHYFGTYRFSWKITNTYFTFCRSSAIFCAVVSEVIELTLWNTEELEPYELEEACVIAGSEACANAGGATPTRFSAVTAVVTHAVIALRNE